MSARLPRISAQTCVLLGVGEVAVARSRRREGRIALAEPLERACRARRRARPRKNTRWPRCSARPRSASIRSIPATRSGSGSPSSLGRPDDALAVGAHEPAAGDDLAHARVVVHRDELGRVDRHVLRVAALGDDPLDGRERARPCRARSMEQPRTSARAGHAAAAVSGARPRELGDHGGGRALGRLAVPQRDRAGRRRGRRELEVEQARGSSPSRTFVPWLIVTGPLRVRPQRVAGDARARRPPPGRRPSRSRSCRRRPAATGSRGSPPGRCSARPPPRAARARRRVREPRAGARVDREDDRRLRRERAERVDDPGEARGIVDVRRPVERDEQVVALRHAVATSRRRARAPGARSGAASRSSCCRRSGRGSGRCPRAARLLAASGLWVSSRSETRSVRTRLISSGIAQSPERRPDSRWATGIPSLAAARAQASVELTSPATTTTAGRWLEEDPLELDQHLARLLAVRARAHPERVVGRREAEIVEDLLGHPPVVVLARVDDDLASGSRARRARR